MRCERYESTARVDGHVRVPREAACGTERGGMRYTRGSKRGCTIFKVDRWVACGVVGALSKNQETSRILSVRALKPLQTSLPPFGSFWVSFIEKGELATMYGGELQFHPCRENGWTLLQSIFDVVTFGLRPASRGPCERASPPVLTIIATLGRPTNCGRGADQCSDGGSGEHRGLT